MSVIILITLDLVIGRAALNDLGYYAGTLGAGVGSVLLAAIGAGLAFRKPGRPFMQAVVAMIIPALMMFGSTVSRVVDQSEAASKFEISVAEMIPIPLITALAFLLAVSVLTPFVAKPTNEAPK